MEIAQEIINENRSLDTDLLYSRAKKRLKISRSGLLHIIQSLFNRNILVPGAKNTKETVLLNPDRKRIYHFITTHLGVHFSTISKQVISDIEDKRGSAGQLIWHLEMLIKFNYIKKIKFKKYMIYVPIDLNDDLAIYYFLLREKISRKIVNLLIQQESIEKSEIHKHLHEKRELVYYRINDLIENNIIIEMEEEGSTLRLNPNNNELIVQILNEFSEQTTLKKKTKYS